MKRLALQGRTVDAIVTAAEARGAYASPVLNLVKGITDEVFLYRGGALVATVFRTTPGRLHVWRQDGGGIALAPDVETAVERALDPLRKQQRKAPKPQQIEGRVGGAAGV